jgi:hypothetical protein
MTVGSLTKQYCRRGGSADIGTLPEEYGWLGIGIIPEDDSATSLLPAVCFVTWSSTVEVAYSAHI